VKELRAGQAPKKSRRRARSAGKHREVKRHYILAIVCYLLIPVAVVAGAAAHQLIAPEMARFHADYTRRYQLLDRTRTGLLMASWALACALWVACCSLVLESRQRSRRWLSLAAAGPFGFSVIAALEDRAPAPRDLYQRFITSLKTYWRVPLELTVFVLIWVVSYNAIVIKRDVLIQYETYRTGTPVATIIDLQNQSSGMWAAGEGMEQFYLVPLMYLLWPIVFNVVGRRWRR